MLPSSAFRGIASALATAAALLVSAGAHAQALTLKFDELSGPSGTLAAGVQLQHSSNSHFVSAALATWWSPCPPVNFWPTTG